MIRGAYYRWLDKRTDYYRRRAELAEGERDAAVATLWLVRDAFGHVVAGQKLDAGEDRQILDTADRVLDRLLTTNMRRYELATEGDGALGNNVRDERLRRGHTQVTLGQMLDLGRGTVAAIETGKVTNPGVYTLYGIAVALGVPMEDLMGVQRVLDTTKGRSRTRESERRRRREDGENVTEDEAEDGTDDLV